MFYICFRYKFTTVKTDTYIKTNTMSNVEKLEKSEKNEKFKALKLTMDKIDKDFDISKYIIYYMFIQNLEKAAIDKNFKKIIIAGGVSANSKLRREAERLCQKHKWQLYLPELKYCGDNAAINTKGNVKCVENGAGEGI